MKRIISAIKIRIWKLNRKRVNAANRRRLNNVGKTASIISMNCIGGILSHDLGLRFLSPTVNLFMRSEDFTKFCENLEHYLSIDTFEPCTDPSIIEQRTYPIGYLDDLLVFFVHYSSLEEGQKKWNERKQRVNFDNLVIFSVDKEGCTEGIKDRFEKLPYRKVLFTNKPDDKHPSCFYIPGFENADEVGIVTSPVGIKGLRHMDAFDYVALLNGEDSKN